MGSACIGAVLDCSKYIYLPQDNKTSGNNILTLISTIPKQQVKIKVRW